MLLRELGIKTEPVLLSTRDNGIIYPTTPNKSRLNYVIACAEVDGKKYLLDATDLNRPYSMLPFRCMNGKGILAVDENLQWIDLLNNEKDNTRYFGEFRIGPDGTLEGKLNRIYDGYTACYQRDDLLRKGNDQYIKDLTEKIKDAHVDSIKIENGNIASPLTVSYIIQSQEITQNAGDLIFFNTLLGFGESSNPLAPLHRDYPVDLGCPVKKTFGFVIQIPEGYSVESLPQRSSISLPDRAGMFQYTALQVGDKIAVNCIFNISKTFFVMNEYDELREFFTRAIEKMEEKIVLKKI
jgi:hypothetical protein